MTEEEAWNSVEPDKLWLLDKLILSRKLGYKCGPIGTDVPMADYYIIRPCVNALGMGLGAHIIFIDCITDNLPLGCFWCEIFEGQHITVDYQYGKPVLAAEGKRSTKDLSRWDEWIRISTQDAPKIPDAIYEIAKNEPIFNCEYIGDKLIEVHFRENPDFQYNNSEFIPVYSKEIRNFDDYTYIECPDGPRIGAFVR